MDAKLVPKMQKIKVNPNNLILDPNNPRFISKAEDRVDMRHFLDPGVIEETREKMMGGGKDDFRIKELEDSIRKNSWQPVDFIFVRKHDDNGNFIVLEGNRRVTAVRNLLKDKDLPKELRAKLSEIEVMDITEDLSPDELEKKVSYLLGVRHHGSLKQWSPFAQAHNMYVQYINMANQKDESFVWEESYGEKIAHALSVRPETVKERLKVYRAMRQIGSMANVKESEKVGGGIKDRYFSVCQEILLKKTGVLNDYIKKDPDTFLLEDIALDRMDNLCHFSKPNRIDAPVNNPQQWRHMQKILEDPDPNERTKMREEVEIEKKKPEIVYAKRAEELRKLRWDKWLKKVALVLEGVPIKNIKNNDDEKRVIQALISLLEQLGPKVSTEVQGGNDA